jgi:hypothetical protein
MTVNEEEQHIRAMFLSLSCLQGFGRYAKEEAMPPDELTEEIGEWAAFKAMSLIRSTVGDLAGLTVFDDSYRLLHMGSVEGKDGTVAKTIEEQLSDTKRWLRQAAKLLAKNPTSNLFAFHDTIMVMETDEAKANRLLDTTRWMISDGQDGVKWLCENGGKKVTVATLMNINGVQSQLMFGHNTSNVYGMAQDFHELMSLVAKNSTAMIDDNMEFLIKLAKSEARNSKWYADLLIKRFNEKDFLWLDTFHSEPMMELLLHFGLGTKDDIEEAIGQQIVQNAMEGEH